MARHLKFGAWCILAVLTLSLIACGGDGGGVAPALSVTGTVSDSTQAPVSGATVAVYNAAGTRIAQGTTNAVGRYSFYGLPFNVPLTYKVTGPAGTFPAQAEKVTLAGGAATVLDFYLPSSAPATEAVAVQPNLWQSQAQIDGPGRAYLGLAAAPAAAPTLAPVDVSQIGDGFPVYSVNPLALGVDEIFELYAAASFSFTGTLPGGTTLYLPVPPALYAAASTAVGPVLYRFNEATAAWVAEAAVPSYFTFPDPALGNFFAVPVTQAGYYRVGKAVAATPVTGTLTYSDGTTPAAGVTVHATGSDYGYQQVLVTDKNGQFTALVKTGGTTNYTFTAWGYGVQLSQASATASATLDFAKPTYGVAAKAKLTLDDAFIPPNNGPDNIGLIVGSGRIRAIESVPPNFTEEKVDVTFVANSFDLGTGTPLSLNATTKGSGIQAGAAGKTFANQTVAPATGYADYTTFASIPIPTTIPAGGLLVLVKTSAGYAKISIDSVTETPAASGNWVIEFRSAFSLSGSF